MEGPETDQGNNHAETANQAQRLQNLRGAFRTRMPIDGRRVLVIDDAVKIAATATEITRTLLAAGIEDVVVMALAGASDPRD